MISPLVHVGETSKTSEASSSGTENRRIICGGGTEEVVTGRVHLLHRDQGRLLCWPRIAAVPLQVLKSAVSLVLCIMLGSLSGSCPELQPVLSACPLYTNSECGKKRRVLIGPW